MPAAGAATPRRAVLLDFDDADEIRQWMTVNDVVMGGMSRSVFEQAGPGIARFRGVVSLENSGGFASARTSPRRWNSSGASAFVLRVLGDGRVYKFTVRTDDGFDGVQYQSRFTPPAVNGTRRACRSNLFRRLSADASCPDLRRSTRPARARWD